MSLIKGGEIVTDPFTDVSDQESITATGPVIISLEQWKLHKALFGDRDLGIKLRSDQSPDEIASDLDKFKVIALEFPAFRDGRAYSYARILRERYAYRGEIRAVGEVLMDQLHFMMRVGFDAFEINSEDPLSTYQSAVKDFSVWYQPTGDGRKTAVQLRWLRS